VRKLSADEFKATTGPAPVRVGVDEAPPFDFWGYFDAIPEEDFGGHDFSAGRVEYAWRMPVHEHVLVNCGRPNVYLVLVLYLDARRVAGHHLLDLNEIYGV
jgi:hypothetical protein